MEITVAARYCGPPTSGNGGYTAGLIATRLPYPVAVTLRTPPPLDTPLRLRIEDKHATLCAGEVLVAEADPVQVLAEPVAPVSADQAWAAAQQFPGLTAHPFPTCYVCGPQRRDGLGIFPGRLPDGRTAAPWTVPAQVTEPTVWAALDCPGGWTIKLEERPAVLGRIAARIHTLPAPGQECVVVGEPRGRHGRKVQVATGLYGADGELLAHCEAVWIELR